MPLAWYSGPLLLDQAVNSAVTVVVRERINVVGGSLVQRKAYVRANPVEDLQPLSFWAMLVKDFSRNIIPLFVHQNSTSLCTVIFLHEYFPPLQSTQLCCIIEPCHYNSTQHRDEVPSQSIQKHHRYNTSVC